MMQPADLLVIIQFVFVLAVLFIFAVIVLLSSSQPDAARSNLKQHSKEPNTYAYTVANPRNPAVGHGSHGSYPRKDHNDYPNPRNPNSPHYELLQHLTDHARHNRFRGQINQHGETERNKKFDGPVFGYKRLFRFLSEAPDNVIIMIHRNLTDWEVLLDQDAISCRKKLRSGRWTKSDDLLYIIVELLGEKVCSSSTVLSTDQNAIISATVGSRNFLQKAEEKAKSYMMLTVNHNRNGRPKTEFDINQTAGSYFHNLIKFVRFTADKMPSNALDFLQNISLSILSVLMYIHTSSPLGDLLKRAQELVNIMKAIEKERQRKDEAEEKSRRRAFKLAGEQESDALPPPDNYKDIPIVPDIQEIRTNQEPFLRPNKTTGAYNDAHHYLDVQFRLLREDFVRPLKLGVCDYLTNKADYLSKRKRPPIGNVRVYPKVTYADVTFERGTVVHYMQLHPDSYKKVKWDKSKRLLSGTLLVFTTDDFETASFGIVYQRNDFDLKKGKLAITWDGDSPELDKQAEFLMVECEVYFEAYRHTLQVLKDIKLEDFPMAKFIVEASTSVKPPAYLQENNLPLRVGNYSCSPLSESTWPNAKNLGFDQKQYEAYHTCLTKEFTIVQGPPGTGKTFLALQVVEVFLRNLQVWSPGGTGGPILVVSYTNHALDQFLQGCLRVFEKLNASPNIVRVGGRCKTEELEEFTLSRLRTVHQKLHQDPLYGKMKSKAYPAMRMAESALQDALATSSALSNADGIILFEKLLIYDDLMEEIPKWILQLVNKPEWFALDDTTVKRFTVEQLLSQWFQITCEAEAHGIAGASSSSQNQPESSDSEDGEDYNIEELEGNRVVDGGYAADIEAIAPMKTSPESFAILLFDAPKRSLEEQLAKLEWKRQEKKGGKTASLDAEIRSLESQYDLLEKKEAICKAVIKAYRQKTLHVEDVKEYFREGGSELRNARCQVATKWSIYFYILERAKVIAGEKLRKLSADMCKAQKRWQEVLRYGDGRILSQSLIVGMTTTGAAKYNDLLRMTKSRIVLVEEAAEVLESHVVTCITPACQHLILIGDHQQLRPSTTVYELAKNYQLDISLFERMVKNKLNCYKLNVQHRMRPEIADLVVGTIYPELYNAPRVSQYPPVLGVTSNLFFIDHEFEESEVCDTKSKSNAHEAKFMAALCRYFIQNGYKPEQITILTTYAGQMSLIKQCMRPLPACQGVRVTCVDGFQGEENDIILLSLVRSNEKGNIGFLKTDNRICVALSRAKHGLFIIGNMSQLERARTWKKIKAKLQHGQRIGTCITIQCQVHGTQQHVSNSKEFSRLAPEGGCNQECTTALKCGHLCKSVCHIQDRDHVVYKCKERCIKFCCRNHRCAAECFLPCPPCRVQVTKHLECQHSARVNCHEYENDVTCSVVVDKMLPCGHEEKLACYVDPIDYECKRKVLKDLPCGHKKEVECHIDVNKITCGEMVDKLLPCGHVQTDKCWKKEDTINCVTMVERVFDLCGHKTRVKCSVSKDPNMKCKTPCGSNLECGHACTLVCHKNDDPHHAQYTCKKDCHRVCENGHSCSSKHQCNKPCPPCRKLLEKQLPCGHMLKLPCFNKEPTSEEGPALCSMCS